MPTETKNSKMVQLLGYLGLVPFVFPSVIVWNLSFNTPVEFLFLIFCSYSLLVCSFLAGSIWAFNINLNQSPLGSIVLFFMPFFASILMLVLFNQAIALSVVNINAIEHLISIALLLLLLSSYVVLYVYEVKLLAHKNYYRKMRFWLTLIVILAHSSWLLFFYINFLK
jgi:hypothetical protein